MNNFMYEAGVDSAESELLFNLDDEETLDIVEVLQQYPPCDWSSALELLSPHFGAQHEIFYKLWTNECRPHNPSFFKGWIDTVRNANLQVAI